MIAPDNDVRKRYVEGLNAATGHLDNGAPRIETFFGRHRPENLRFDEGGLLSEVGTRDAGSGREVVLVSRETPTAGHSFTVIEQILGNIGRFRDPAAPQ